MRISTFLVLSLVAVQVGCSKDDPPSGMRLTVQKWLADPGCWATMTLDTPVEPALELADICGDTTEPRLAGGLDRVRAVIDYGDLTFTPATTVSPPKVTMILDGVETPAGESFDEPPRQARAYFLATFTAPAKQVAAMQLEASATEGFSARSSTSMSVAAPSVDIAVQQCPTDSACTLEGGVGSAVVFVTVPVVTPQTVKVSWTLDGVLQPQTQDVSVNVPQPQGMTGSTFISVPSGRAGAQWVLTAQLGSERKSTHPILLQVPPITASIGCASPCQVKAGSAVGLIVTAPAEIQTRQAVVLTTVNGVPGITGATLNLTTEDASQKQVTGILSLPVPEAPEATWVIDVSLGAYRAPSIIASITPE